MYLYNNFTKPSIEEHFKTIFNTLSDSEFENYISEGISFVNVAGFSEDDLNIEYADGNLYINGTIDVEGKTLKINKTIGKFKNEPNVYLKNGLIVIDYKPLIPERKKISLTTK